MGERTEVAEAGSAWLRGHSTFSGLCDLGHQGASLSLSADKVPREANHCPSGSLSFTGLSTWESRGWDSWVAGCVLSREGLTMCQEEHRNRGRAR